MGTSAFCHLHPPPSPGLKWYSPVIFHGLLCPRMWVWLSVGCNLRLVSPLKSLEINKKFPNKCKMLYKRENRRLHAP